MTTAVMLAVMWNVTALDPSHLVVQADRTDVEQAAFQVSDADLAMTGWKYDSAIWQAAQKATAGRAAFEDALSKGPYTVAGRNATFGYWVTANGSQRFQTRPGKPAEPVRLVRPLYNVFLKLASPLEAGQKVTIGLPTGETLDFTYDPNVPSPLFKVNQVGYSVDAKARFAYLGGWLGPLGPYPKPADGTTFELVNAKTGAVALSGEAKFRMVDRSRTDKFGPTPFTGEETVEMDISAAQAGRYFVRIAGIGRSMDFNVDKTGVADVFALHMKGLYQQRCGCEKTQDLTHWTDDACHLKVHRGFGPPEEWEYPERIVDDKGQPLKANHFAFNNWQNRLVQADPKALEELSLPGGWHDAADYDRRPMHMRIVGDLATLYLLKPENFTDSQLAVPERGNGIPDILDEAVWGLRHLLKGQQKDGGVGTWIEATRHPEEKTHSMASQDPLPYFLAKATRASSMEYASYAALLARALEKAGDKASLEWAKRFRESAIRAYEYATTAAPTKNLPVKSGWEAKNEVSGFYNEVDNPPPAEQRAKAAVNLYVLTKDQKYAAALTEDVVKDVTQRVNQKGWSMSAFILSETAFTEVPGDSYAKIKQFWHDRALKEGNEVYGWVYNSWAYRLPYYPSDSGWVHTMSWGNIHPFHQAKKLIAAHIASGEKKFLDAAYLAMDFHCGCNPNGQTWTAGLGKVYPTSYLSLVSCADGIAEYVPGIPPYRNSFGLCPEVSKQVFQWDGANCGLLQRQGRHMRAFRRRGGRGAIRHRNSPLAPREHDAHGCRLCLEHE